MSRWSEDGRPTPNGWAAIGAAAVICAAATWFWVVDPAEGGQAVSGSAAAPVREVPSGPPSVTEPWYRVGLPVDGDLVPVGAPTTGHVRVEAGDDNTVQVDLTGFTTDAPEADLRVQLTEGDVVRYRGGWAWVPDGDPVEVGMIRDGATTATIAVRTPQMLPTEVHSVVVLDWNTTTILGAAELLPARAGA